MTQLIFMVQNKRGIGVGLSLNEAQAKLKHITDKKGKYLSIFNYTGEKGHMQDAMNSIQVYHISMMWDMSVLELVHEEEL